MKSGGWRLAGRANADRIDARWEPGVEAHLAGALPDFDSRQQVLLANRIGVELAPASYRTVEMEEWDGYAERVARERRLDRDTDGAIDILDQRTDWHPGSRFREGKPASWQVRKMIKL